MSIDVYEQIDPKHNDAPIKDRPDIKSIGANLRLSDSGELSGQAGGGGGGNANLSDETPQPTGTDNSAGDGTAASRDDHIHKGVQLSDDDPQATGTADAGTATDASRSDHVHAPTGNLSDDEPERVGKPADADKGTGTSASRSDHVHGYDLGGFITTASGLSYAFHGAGPTKTYNSIYEIGDIGYQNGQLIVWALGPSQVLNTPDDLPIVLAQLQKGRTVRLADPPVGLPAGEYTTSYATERIFTITGDPVQDSTHNYIVYVDATEITADAKGTWPTNSIQPNVFVHIQSWAEGVGRDELSDTAYTGQATIALSNATPQPTGTAAAGTSNTPSRSDHVHADNDEVSKEDVVPFAAAYRRKYARTFAATLNALTNPTGALVSSNNTKPSGAPDGVTDFVGMAWGASDVDKASLAEILVGDGMRAKVSANFINTIIQYVEHKETEKTSNYWFNPSTDVAETHQFDQLGNGAGEIRFYHRDSTAQLRSKLPTGTDKNDGQLTADTKIMLGNFDTTTTTEYAEYHDEHHTGLTTLTGYKFVTSGVSAAGDVRAVVSGDSYLVTIKPLTDAQKASLKAKLVTGREFRLILNASNSLVGTTTNNASELFGNLSFNIRPYTLTGALTNNHAASLVVALQHTDIRRHTRTVGRQPTSHRHGGGWHVGRLFALRPCACQFWICYPYG